MRELRYTLVTDGPSDDALIPLLTWVLRMQGMALPIVPTWADLRRLASPPKRLSGRIRIALDLYPCDLLFVHRDAEGQSPDRRREEIRDALLEAGVPPPPAIGIVPIRMTEAWLLFDEPALRWVAENPNGKMGLDLPRIADLESVPDPKALLYEILLTASGLKGRRRRKFSLIGRARRIAERLDDFTPLRGLSAFNALEDEVTEMVQKQSWRTADE